MLRKGPARPLPGGGWVARPWPGGTPFPPPKPPPPGGGRSFNLKLRLRFTAPGGGWGGTRPALPRWLLLSTWGCSTWGGSSPLPPRWGCPWGGGTMRGKEGGVGDLLGGVCVCVKSGTIARNGTQSCSRRLRLGAGSAPSRVWPVLTVPFFFGGVGGGRGGKEGGRGPPRPCR